MCRFYYQQISQQSLSVKPLATVEQTSVPTIAPQSTDWQVAVSEHQDAPSIESSLLATCSDTAGTSTRLHNGVAAATVNTLCFGDVFSIACTLERKRKNESKC